MSSHRSPWFWHLIFWTAVLGFVVALAMGNDVARGQAVIMALIATLGLDVNG